ncbi:RNA polymerase sigma factor [Chloroflexota bacterium]
MQGARDTEKAADIDLLVIKAAGGDADAFGRLYDMYVDRAYRHVYYRVGTAEDTEDLTQQVFLRAWQAIGRYKKTSSPFLAWLMKISHNLVIDFYRSKKDKAYLDFEIVASDSHSSPERVAETEFDQQQVRRAILRLPADQQQVVLMSFIEGFSYAEIASTLGKSEGAIRVIQHRALKKMRNILEEEKGSD